MNLFELFVKIGAKDEASGTISKITSGLGKGLATAAKIGTAAVGAAAAGITALTTAAVNNYAEYEQLVGGVDTLFKDASQKVQQYAADAYKTAGMSANDYMANATAFSASLISSLGGDTEKAAEYANRAMVSMSDNANKMGTSLDSIVQTYQSLSRGNMAMLDNLKLGYGGTKAELERLIKDAASYTDIQKEMGITVDASSMSFDNIVNAIAVVQGKLGIAGATAAEASTTIEGSVNSMKAAWSNLVTGIADENAEFGTLVNNFVESAATALDNILPRIEESLYGVDALIYRMFPIIMERIPQIISDFLPRFVETATMIVQSVVDGISQNQGMLMTTAFDTIVFLANSLISMLPQIVALGLDLIVSLAEGIVENVDELLPAVLEAIMAIGEALIEHAPELINAGIELASAIMNGVLEQFEGLEPIIMAVVAAFGAYKAITLASEIASKAMAAGQWLVNAAMNANPIMLIVTLIAGLVAAIVTLWNTNEGFRNALIGAWEAIKSAAQTIFSAVANFFTETIPNAFNSVIDWFKDVGKWFADIGENIVNGIKDGISGAWNGLVKWFNGLWDGLVGGVKDFLGIHSPSRVFAGIGKNMALGVGEGWEDEFGDIQGDIDKSLSFDDASVGINASIRKVGAGAAGGAFGGTSIGNITINIDGAKYSDEQSLASAIALEIQNMTDRRAAVYA